MRTLRLYLEVIKLPMSLMISFSAAFGFIMQKNSCDRSFWLTAAGILMLACGGACLNNFQDRHIDRCFSRTKNRALPSNQLPPGRALMLSALLIITGIWFLYGVRYDLALPLMGAAALMLYNGIYTPLKPRTVLAILPGAACGMMPPFIGWMAAGGHLLSLKIISIMVLFGIWQLPHFWLVLLAHTSEYQKSALPTMLKRFNRFQLEKITFIWIINFIVMLLFVPVLFWGGNQSLGWMVAVSAPSVILLAFSHIFYSRGEKKYRSSSWLLNGSIFFVMLVIMAEKLAQSLGL